MNNEQTSNVIEFLNEAWPQKPLGETTAALWGHELSRFPHEDVITALRGLARTSEWRPTLATILKALVRPGGDETASEAFTTVWKEIGRVGRGGCPSLSPRTSRAVRHLGGWESICMTWQIDKMQWHRKEFVAEFDQLSGVEQDRALLALDAPKSREIAGRSSQGAPVSAAAVLKGWKP